MRKRSSKGIAKTIILLISIIIAGYFITSMIYNFLPSYKYEVREIENVNSVKRLFYLEEEPIVYPWSYLDKGHIEIISEEDKNVFNNKNYHKGFYGKNIVDFIMQMMDLHVMYKKEDEVINSFQYLVGIENDKNDHGKVLIINNDFTNIFNEQYNIKFSLDENGQVSYKCKATENLSSIDNEMIEKAYELLDGYTRNDDSKLVDYLKDIYRASQRNYAYEILNVLDNILISYMEDGYTKLENSLQDVSYEIFSTESELMVIYTLDNGTMVIVYFDPISKEFCGFNIQNY
jgi:hypothetical protein